jgi:glycosyltransferase involved in cell wall biosynthesis
MPEEGARLGAAFEAADVFCLPTRYEPFGIAYIEAMAYSLPCVGPDAWAVPEMIGDGVTGFVVPPEDTEALASRLVTLLTDPELAARLGAAGRRRAEEYFTWAATVERMLRVLEPLVAGEAGRR